MLHLQRTTSQCTDCTLQKIGKEMYCPWNFGQGHNITCNVTCYITPLLSHHTTKLRTLSLFHFVTVPFGSWYFIRFANCLGFIFNEMQERWHNLMRNIQIKQRMQIFQQKWFDFYFNEQRRNFLFLKTEIMKKDIAFGFMCCFMWNIICYYFCMDFLKFFWPFSSTSSFHPALYDILATCVKEFLFAFVFVLALYVCVWVSYQDTGKCHILR